MSWININEHGVPVNDDRYHNRFSLSLDYTSFYGHGVCTKTEDVIARYNTKYFSVAEKEYYKKVSDVKKKMEERGNVC